jgi:hypothetical protein
MSWEESEIREVINRLLDTTDEDEKITEEQMQEWHEQDIEDGLY